MAGKGKKRYWKAMRDNKTGEKFRIPDYGYPVTINGRQFFCNLTQFPEDDEIITDKYTGYAAKYGSIKNRFDKYLELSCGGVDVMTLPEKIEKGAGIYGNL